MSGRVSDASRRRQPWPRNERVSGTTPGEKTRGFQERWQAGKSRRVGKSSELGALQTQIQFIVTTTL